MKNNASPFAEMPNASAAATETDVQHLIVNALRVVFGAELAARDILQNASLPGADKRPDIVVGRAVIEVKKPGEDLPVHEPQLRQHLQILRRYPSLGFEADTPPMGGDWRGFLTDGRLWLRYELEADGARLWLLDRLAAEADKWTEFCAWLRGGAANRRRASTPSQQILVEERFVLSACFSDNVAPFRLLGCEQILAPWSAESGVLRHMGTYPLRLLEQWLELNHLWKQKRKSGTPEVLSRQIDYQGKLTSQLKCSSPGKNKVVYPLSGAIFFAARIPSSLICSGTLYWHIAKSAKEARYLTAALNSGVLHPAFLSARRGRHFTLNALRHMPIPAFNPADPTHLRLAALAAKAEKIAATAQPPKDKSPTRTNMAAAIKQMLGSAGIMRAIDAAVAEILPDFV